MYNRVFLKKQIEDSCEIKSEDKKGCTIRKRSGHTKESCFYKQKGGVFALVTQLEICPICKETLHRFNVTQK